MNQGCLIERTVRSIEPESAAATSGSVHLALTTGLQYDSYSCHTGLS